MVIYFSGSLSLEKPAICLICMLSIHTIRGKPTMISTIIIGFIIGILAKFLYPGGQRLGIIMTTLLGIGGSVLASWVGQTMGWYAIGQPAGWIASTLGAMGILAIFASLRK
jgi:hypothetical protein